MSIINDLHIKASGILTLSNYIDIEIEKTEAEIERISARVQILRDASALAKFCTNKFLDQIYTIEDIISDGLSYVLEKDLIFKFEKITSDEGILKGLKPVVQSPNGHVENPTAGFGSSVTQITAILLRLCVIGIVGTTKPIIIMDEPFSHINTSLRDRLGEFVTRIAEEMKVQIITVSHMKTAYAKVYEVENVGGMSKVTLASI